MDRHKLWLRKWLTRLVSEGQCNVTDIQEIDFDAYFDSSLTYAENKQIFQDMYVVNALVENPQAEEEYLEELEEQKEELRSKGVNPEFVDILSRLDYKKQVWLKALVDELEGEIKDLNLELGRYENEILYGM